MKPLLIMKTGSTLESLRARGEDFHHWIIRELQVAPDQVEVRAVDEGELLPAPTAVSGVVITGSPAMVTDGAPWNDVAAAWLREAIDADLPVLGICYGHQLLAYACGGKVDYHPAGREIGTVDVSLTPSSDTDPLLADLPAEFPAHATHSQSVLVLPADAVHLARSAHDQHHAFRVGRAAWGLQFHPEFDAAIMTSYIEERAGDLRDEGWDVDQLLDQVRETPEATGLLSRFARLAGL